MLDKIHVAILDSYQGIIDVYKCRLSRNHKINVVTVGTHVEDFEEMIANHSIDVLLLDISLSYSPENPNPTPIINNLPKLLDKFPGLYILVLTMHNERYLAKSVMKAGASGYVLKDDQTIISQLDSFVLSIFNDGIALSSEIRKLLLPSAAETKGIYLTDRQSEMLTLCALHPDWKSEAIAEELGISNSSARALLFGAYLLLDVDTRPAAVEKAQDLGLLGS